MARDHSSGRAKVKRFLSQFGGKALAILRPRVVRGGDVRPGMAQIERWSCRDGERIRG